MELSSEIVNVQELKEYFFGERQLPLDEQTPICEAA